MMDRYIDKEILIASVVFILGLVVVVIAGAMANPWVIRCVTGD